MTSNIDQKAPPPASLAGRDTIFAPASGQGRAAVATIRISGPGAADAVGRLLSGRLPEPRRASLRHLADPETGEVLDQALVIWMPGPASFTGEDQAELQIHGSVAVRAAILRALARCPACRAAEPGEFTRRAFLNGKLDLTAVEGLADLIEAETEAQRRQALRQLEGRLAEQVETWRERLLDALASCEAALDFVDEDDVPEDVAAGAAGAGEVVRLEIASALAQADRGERVREGFQVVIAGPPNAGKSTLLNALALRDVAIVSPIPGTTRDVIEVRCNLGGLPVTLIDTAGLRESDEHVEREGIARAKARMGTADLVLWLMPMDELARDIALPPRTGPSHLAPTSSTHLPSPLRGRVGDGGRAGSQPVAVCPTPPTPVEGSAFVRPSPQGGGTVRGYPLDPTAIALPGGRGGEGAADIPYLVVATKTDLGPAPAVADVAVSAKTGEGMSDLLVRIEEIASRAMDGGGDAVLTRERHRAVLTQVVACLERAALAGQAGAIELVAEDLRLALRHLGRMTGAVDVEEVLDRIFSSFCIGK